MVLVRARRAGAGTSGPGGPHAGYSVMTRIGSPAW
jgi:hypothetical protein